MRHCIYDDVDDARAPLARGRGRETHNAQSVPPIFWGISNMCPNMLHSFSMYSRNRIKRDQRRLTLYADLRNNISKFRFKRSTMAMY